MTILNRTRVLTVSALLLLPSLAQAHPGHAHEAGLVAGLVHPFTGVDHAAAVALAGLLLGWLRGPGRWLVFAAFLALTGAIHVAWIAPAAGAGYVTGLMLASAALAAAGMAATRRLRITGVAARSRTWAAGGSAAHRPCARR
jgi:urease accessory protein